MKSTRTLNNIKPIEKPYAESARDIKHKLAQPKLPLRILHALSVYRNVSHKSLFCSIAITLAVVNKNF